MKKISIVGFLLIAINIFSQSYNIKLNLKNGETYYMNNNINMNMTQKVMGQEIPMVMNMIISMSYKVMNIDQDIYTLQSQYDFVSNEMDMMGKSIKMASNLDQTNPANKMFAGLVNVPYTMKVRNNGEVISVEGYEKVLESMKNSLPEEVREQMSEELGKSFSKEKATESLKATFFSIPPKSVKIGDTWQTSYYTENNGIQVKNNMNCKLESVNDKSYKISYTGSLVSEGSGKMKKNGMDIDIKKLDGNLNGLIELDKNSSWIKNTDSKGKMNIMMEMKMGESPMQMESNIDMNTKINDLHVAPPPIPMPAKTSPKIMTKKTTTAKKLKK